MIGTQVEYANHIGVSKQAVSKMVKQGKITLRTDGKVDFAAADHARGKNLDPAFIKPSSKDASTDLLQDVTPSADERNSPSYSQARTAREAYQAKMAKLEYERQVGLYLPKQDIEDALVASGRTIRQGLDAMIGWADELDAAARHGGADAVRRVLKERVKGLEDMIVTSLNLLAQDE